MLQSNEISSLLRTAPQNSINLLIDIFYEGKIEETLLKTHDLIEKYPNTASLHNILGVTYYAKGKVDKAVYHLKQVLVLEPRSHIAHYNLGCTLIELGRYEEAEKELECTIQIAPNYAEAHYNLGNSLKLQNKFDEAANAYRKTISLNPNYDNAYYSLGAIFHERENLDLAIESYRKALKINPKNANSQHSLDVALKQKSSPNIVTNKTQSLIVEPSKREVQALVDLYNDGQYEASLLSATMLINSFPETLVLFNIQGASNTNLQRYDAAIKSFKQALKIAPNYADAHNNMGNALREKGELDSAMYSYNQALSIQPDFAEVHYNIGTAQQKKGELIAAITSYKKALNIKPNYADALYNLGNSQLSAGKLDEAIGTYKQVIEVKKDYADAYNNLGNAQYKQNELELSIKSYQQALKIKPNCAYVHYNLGNALKDNGKINLAINSYEKALKIKPDYPLALASKLHQQANIGDWDGIEVERHRLSKLGTSMHGVSPWAILALEDAPERHQLRAEIYANSTYKEEAFPLRSRPNKKPKRLRIGYFSQDFQNHPITYLILRMLELHNRDLFEIYAYSFGQDTQSEMRQKIIQAVDFFKDTSSKTDKEMVQIARDDKIDIAIDLAGYTNNNRAGAFALRLAPIQINYLGFPSTMGTKFMDYIIADKTVIPRSMTKCYSEKIICLPNSFMVTDNTRKISKRVITRSEMGLPEKGFVFCCFNNNYKISSNEFDIWMRILTKVEGSVLWLRRSNEWSSANFRKEAKKRGVNPSRLIFAEKVPMEEHLARHRLADLFIDTFNYNAHTTATEALWLDLPIVTKIGKAFASRVASSLLKAIELPELITKTENEYEALILKLAKNPKFLMRIRRKLKINRLSKPLFNTELFTQNLENVYQRIYQQYFDKKNPKAILTQSE